MDNFPYGPYDQSIIDDRRHFVSGPTGVIGPVTATFFHGELFYLVLLLRQYPRYHSAWTFRYQGIADRHFAQLFTISPRRG
jgi:hypothetical protein